MISNKVLLIVSIALVYLTVANAFEFQCEFSMKREYSCDAQNLKIDGPHNKITRVSGTHLLELKNSDVKYLGINEQNIKFLPINLAEYFPNLKKLQVKKTDLEYVTEYDFLGLTQLTHIVMGSNKIKELPCGVFSTNKRLQQIYFEENSLNQIGKDIFKPLPLLSLANFRKNECINKDVDKIESVPGLLNDMAKKCKVNCDKTGSYRPSPSTYNADYYKIFINELGNTIYNQDILIENLESNLSFEKDEHEKTKEEKTGLENAVNDITATNINLITELDASKDQNLKITEKKNQLEDTIKNVESEYESFKDAKLAEIKVLNIEMSKKDNEILESNNTITTMVNTINNLEKDLEASKDENLKITEKKNQLENIIKDLELGHETFKDEKQAEIETLIINISNKDNEILQSKNETKTLENTVHSLEKDLEASNMENIELTEEKNQLQLEHESFKDAKQNETENSNNVISTKDNEILKVKEKFKTSENTVQNITAKNSILQKNLAATKVEIVKISKNKDELIEKHQKLIAAAKLLEKNLKTTITNKDKNIVKNTNEIKNLQIKVKTVTATNQILKKDLDASKLEIVKINKENNELNQNINELEIKHNETVEDAIQNKVIKESEIARLENNIQNINETLGSTAKNWTIRCSNDYHYCQTKYFSVAVETSDYTNLKTFHEYKIDGEFRIENSKIKSLSNNFFKHYPLIKFFLVTASNLRTIKNGNFMNADHLLQIVITRSQIRSLEEFTFEGAEKVELINLSFNRIESVSNKAFIGLKKLKELNLSNNQIKLKHDTFVNLPTLEVLHMESNALSAISSKLFRNNERLRRVYFNRNQLKYINPQIFEELRFLVYVNLLDNSCINKEFKELNDKTMMVSEIFEKCVQIGKIK